MKKTIIPTIIFTLILLLSSCPSPTTGSSYEPPNSEDPVIVEDEDLFIPSGQTALFSTNIFEFGAGNGATYWSETESAVQDFYNFTVRLDKISGYSLGGYGVFFAQRNSGTTDFSALAVLINMTGEYCVGLIADGTFTYLKEWTDFSYLNRGYNQNNVLSVEGGGSGEFKISFNGSEALVFEDTSDVVHTGGGFGYLAVVSPLENFPSVPVKVEFEKQS